MLLNKFSPSIHCFFLFNRDLKLWLIVFLIIAFECFNILMKKLHNITRFVFVPLSEMEIFHVLMTP